jgi:hypothetical protein
VGVLVAAGGRRIAQLAVVFLRSSLRVIADAAPQLTSAFHPLRTPAARVTSWHGKAATRSVSLWGGPVRGAEFVRICAELPLLEVPTRDRFGVQTAGGICRTNVALSKGTDWLLIFGDKETAHDVHCRPCGSLLFSVVRGGAYVHVAMGTLVDEPGISPSMHIFVGSKASWHEITNHLPQHRPDCRRPDGAFHPFRTPAA